MTGRPEEVDPLKNITHRRALYDLVCCGKRFCKLRREVIPTGTKTAANGWPPMSNRATIPTSINRAAMSSRVNF